VTGFVVDHPFEQRVADAVHHAASHLSVHQHLIDQLSAIVTDHIACDRDSTGIDSPK